MGADYIAIIYCPLQIKLSASGLAARLKLRVQLSGLEARRAELEEATGKRLEDIPIARGGANNPVQRATYGQLRDIADEVAGIPECASCAVSGGKPLGCYRYITYPIDVVAEEALLDYFVASLDEPGQADMIGRDPSGKLYTAADLLYNLVVSQAPAHTGWHGSRGWSALNGALAQLPVPATRKSRSRNVVLDSAQVLHSVFIPIDGVPALQLPPTSSRASCTGPSRRDALRGPSRSWRGSRRCSWARRPPPSEARSR